MGKLLDAVISEVQSIKRRPDGSAIVTVHVTGVSDKTVEKFLAGRSTPSVAANIRARARALLAAGVLPSSVDTVTDVALGDVQRLTEVISEKDIGDGTLTEKEYKIKVNS